MESSSASCKTPVEADSGVVCRRHVLIAAAGSVATVKVPELATLISEFAEVTIILTEAARHFWDRASVYNSAAWAAYKSAAEKGSIRLFTDSDEWEAWNAMGDAVVHIQLREWADLLLIAPLSANTLSKIAHGLCDNLLTCVARAWDVRKPVLVAPAMNTHMWSHPFTGSQLSILRNQLGYRVIDPASKQLACGDIGTGALAPVSVIVQSVCETLGIPHEEAAKA